MIDREEAQRILKGHLKWVDGKRSRWKRHRDMYGDRFWESEGGSKRGVWVTTANMLPTGEHGDAALETNSDRKIPGLTIEVNLLRPLVTSFVAPLGYQGIHFNVRPDAIDPVGDDSRSPLRAASSSRAILSRSRVASVSSVRHLSSRATVFSCCVCRSRRSRTSRSTRADSSVGVGGGARGFEVGLAGPLQQPSNNRYV